jgi:hypothetical protein
MTSVLDVLLPPDAAVAFAHFRAPDGRAVPSWPEYDSLVTVRAEFRDRVEALSLESSALENRLAHRDPTVGRVRSSARRQEMLARAQRLAAARREADWILWCHFAPEIRERLDALLAAVEAGTFTFSAEYLQHHEALRARFRGRGRAALRAFAALSAVMG